MVDPISVPPYPTFALRVLRTVAHIGLVGSIDGNPTGPILLISPIGQVGPTIIHSQRIGVVPVRVGEIEPRIF